MKRTTITIALITAALATQAQVMDGKTIWQKSVKQILQKTSAAGKAPATAQRLTARAQWVDYGNGLQAEDSLHYIYSGTRGSVFNMDYLFYNDYADGNEVNYDTQLYFTEDNGTLKPRYRYTRNYTANNAVSDFLMEEYMFSIPENNTQTLYTYNGQGLQIKELTLNWNGAASKWDSVFMRRSSYNAQGLLSIDTLLQYNNTTSTWAAFGARSYTYDANGNQLGGSFVNNIGGTWVNNFKFDNTYTAQNKLSTSTYHEYLNGTWTNNGKDSFGYTGSLPYFTYNETMQWQNNAWEPEYLAVKTPDASGMPTMITYYSWTGLSWDIEEQIFFQYNSYGNPTMEYIPGFVNNLYEERYYYELYTTSVRDVANAKDLYTVFPNPATDNINIKAKDGAIKSVSVSNALGQVVMTQTVKDKTAIVNISHLSAGNYLLNITDADGVVSIQKIVKQ